MKKLTAIILTAVLVLALAACGESGTTKETSGEASAISSTAAASTAETSETETTGQTEETSAESTAQATEETSSSSEALSQPVEEEDIPVVDEDVAPLDCVELGEYKGLEVTDAYVAPTEEYIDTYLKSINRAIAVENEEEVLAEGDTANIDYEGKVDGVAFDGGTSAGYDLVIGSGTFVPGFEDGMIGMKKGDVREIEVTFPEDYRSTDLAGKDAVFTVTLNEIKRVPEMNDEWVVAYSGTDCKTLEEFRAYLMEYFENNYKRQAKSTMQLALWDDVVKASKVNKIPKSIYDRAAEVFDTMSEQDAENYGMTLQEYIESAGLTEDQYAKLKEAYAKDSAKNTVLSYAIWDKEGMTTESEEYIDAIHDLEESYQTSEEGLIEAYGEETITNYGKTYGVLSRILSYAKVVPAETEETTESSATSE